MLNPGLYEQLIDNRLNELLSQMDLEGVVRENLDSGESFRVLSQHMTALIAHALASVPAQDKLAQQIHLCNQIIALLSNDRMNSISIGSQIYEPANQLIEIMKPKALGDYSQSTRPETPLSNSCILTATRNDPSLASQLKAEMLTSDSVDILCSFIKWSGIRILEDEITMFTARPNAKLRVITTSYMGATDLKAIEFLRALPNTSVKVSYDTRRTRLHAKAYLFHRDTGFGTAYVGSANLSSAAITDGLEWNVKVSQFEAAHLWDKVSGTFETYWNDSEFADYGADDMPRLAAALKNEQSLPELGPHFQFDLRPYSYQQEILEKLEAERVFRNRHRNLVVAATGTGKTVIAAFDYKKFRAKCELQGKPAKLLFIAHREEILRQSIACFRAVLRDQNFGELMVGNHRPESIDHLFLSIQSYNSRDFTNKIDSEFYDYVVVDEFHHAEAPSYDRLLGHLQPQELLGLTATPERGDGRDVTRFFGGHISAELRLATAINQKLLCPFQYFAVTDSVDLQSLSWQRGGYKVAELSAAYTANHTRADLIVSSVTDKLLDVHRSRGLGFCVNIAHAEYMAAFFTSHGIPAESLTSESPTDVRESVQKRLNRREINFIFTVDLYNEGVDIPEIDTVLFLRPTQSLTVFIQQLGRGLRLCDGKECLTVLDFVGQANQNYDFEMRYRALMDHPRRRIDEEIENGCPHVPLGCTIQLERLAQRYVLENIKAALRNPRIDLTRRIRQFQSDYRHVPTLSEFLEYYELPASRLYDRDTWTNLLANADARPVSSDPDQKELAKGLRLLSRIDSPSYILWLLNLVKHWTVPPEDDLMSSRRLAMFHRSLWGSLMVDNAEESVLLLRRNPDHVAELVELLEFQLEQVSSVPPNLQLPIACPLELHCSYTRNEILAAFGHYKLDYAPPHQSGVQWLSGLNTDILFVTLNKTEERYSPTTMYEDYAISPSLFHWQSQNATSPDVPTGKRYVNQRTAGTTILLCVRENATEDGMAAPYLFLGPVLYRSHTGSKPMSILWDLVHPIPAKLLPVTQRLAIAQ